MAVPFAEDPDDVMVQVLWFTKSIAGDVGMWHSTGVQIISSTAASNSGGYLEMDVHDVPGMLPSNVFGPHAGGVFVGTLGQVHPPSAMPEIDPLPEEAADDYQTGFPVLPHPLAAVRCLAALCSRDTRAV